MTNKKKNKQHRAVNPSCEQPKVVRDEGEMKAAEEEKKLSQNKYLKQNLTRREEGSSKVVFNKGGSSEASVESDCAQDESNMVPMTGPASTDFGKEYVKNPKFLNPKKNNMVKARNPTEPGKLTKGVFDEEQGQGFTRGFKGGTKKKSVASTGTVSAFLIGRSHSSSPISPGNRESDPAREILASFFDKTKGTVQGIYTEDSKNAAKKMQPLGLVPDFGPPCPAMKQHDNGKGECSYSKSREKANQHWEAGASYFEEAKAARAQGERARASNLTDKGKEQTRLARIEDAMASYNTFLERNKDIKNVITINLHEQHVKEAMRIVKRDLNVLRLLVPPVPTLRVITGHGLDHGGESKIRESVIEFLKQKKIKWRPEKGNKGTVLIEPSEYSSSDSEQ